MKSDVCLSCHHEHLSYANEEDCVSCGCSERPHAALGASSAERWMNCPGSLRLLADAPDDTTPYAREGTLAHWLASMALQSGQETGSYVGTVVGNDEITEEMAEAVDVYVQHVRSKIAAAPGSAHFIEVAFSLAKLNPPGEMFGTTDFALWDPLTRTLDIVDYKHGIGVVVSAEENVQLSYYALGAVVALNVRPETICITIVQPRARHKDGEIRSYYFGWEELVSFKRLLFAAAERTLAPDAPLVAGEWCRFCAARPVCPAQRSMALELAQDEFGEMTAQALPPPTALTQAQILRALELAPAIEDWFRSIRQYVQARLESGETVPGWKLVAKRAMRKWMSDEDAEAWLRSVEVEPFVKVLISPAQAETALKRVPKKQRPAIPADLVSKKSSGNTLAPESDSNPAVEIVTAQDEFTAQPTGDTTDGK